MDPDAELTYICRLRGETLRYTEFDTRRGIAVLQGGSKEGKLGKIERLGTRRSEMFCFSSTANYENS